MNNSDLLFQSRIQDIRAASRDVHINIVRLIVEHKALDKLELAKLLKESESTINARLLRLLGIGIIQKQWDNGVRRKLKYKIADDLNGLQIAGKSQEIIKVAKSEVSISPLDLSQVMSKFNPSWPIEWKSTWFAALKIVLVTNPALKRRGLY